MKLQFVTGYLQREVPMDVKVATDLEVGDAVTYTVTDNTITAAAGANDAAKLAAATHFIAQSDQTIGGGYVPTDKGDYKPSKKVAASTTATKKVALYTIFDKNDVTIVG